MAVETRSNIFRVFPGNVLNRVHIPGEPGSHQVAVIDVGSNSTRMEVLQLTADYDLRVMSEVKALLRLASRKSKDGRLLPSAVSDLCRLISDFATVARASNVDDIRAVATSAMRDATNVEEIVEEVKQETGIDLEVITGEREAEYGFLGAVFSLPAVDGVLFDIGGGSVEFSFFEDRSLKQVFTLDLGALRMSNEFLNTEKPEQEAVSALRRHVKQMLKSSGMPPMQESGVLIGAGGTIRNMTKIDRGTKEHSFGRLHGSVVGYGSLKRIVNGLRGLDQTSLMYMPGLNPERTDSILGGAIVASEIAKYFDKKPIIVSGRGIREGLAMSGLIKELPSIDEVRRRSIYALGARFDTWDRLRADRRAAIARKMSELLSEHLEDEMMALIPYIARLIDTGRSVNYYDRYMHAASIIELGELGGFSHRDIGLMAAVLRFGNSNSASMSRYRPELKKRDRPVVRRAASVLRISDEMERRLGAERYSRIGMELVDDCLEVRAPELSAWDPTRFAARFKRVFRLGFAVVR